MSFFAIINHEFLKVTKSISYAKSEVSIPVTHGTKGNCWVWCFSWMRINIDWKQAISWEGFMELPDNILHLKHQYANHSIYKASKLTKLKMKSSTQKQNPIKYSEGEFPFVKKCLAHLKTLLCQALCNMWQKKKKTTSLHPILDFLSFFTTCHTSPGARGSSSAFSYEEIRFEIFWVTMVFLINITSNSTQQNLFPMAWAQLCKSCSVIPLYKLKMKNLTSE